MEIRFLIPTMKTWHRFFLKFNFRLRNYKLNILRFNNLSLKHSFLFLFIFSIIIFIYLHKLQVKFLNQSSDKFVFVAEEYKIHNVRKFYNGYTINKRLKYILLWNQTLNSPFYSPAGQDRFIYNDCKYQNCFVTGNKNYLPNISKFDAIIFDVRDMQTFRHFDVPIVRASKQIYIFYASESPEYYPVCDEKYDGFFNWTVTYRLDSDIPVPYFEVLDIEGKIIAPQWNVKWKNASGEIGRFLSRRLAGKYKAVAWIVSNCFAKIQRMSLANNLQAALLEYQLELDIYGKCGEFDCPMSQQEDCNLILRNDYFFYLAFENSWVPDYVTEKVLLAIDNDIVPIVLGGSHYNKFLPPGSYIDAADYTYEQLAAKIQQIISTPSLYWTYFKWRSKYVIRNADASNICSLCAALNNVNLYNNSAHERLRKWWYPYHDDVCGVIPSTFSDNANEYKKIIPENTLPGVNIV